MLNATTNHDNNAYAQLNHCILQEIKKQNGMLSFERFMSLALYHPLYGYYNRPEFTFGQNGDFITAPELTPLFAYCFAQQIKLMLQSLPRDSCLLELGAGSGKLAHDLIQELKESNQLPHYYYIYEISPTLRKKQQSFLRAAQPKYFSRIIWLSELPKQFTGIILGNELLDALPVHLFVSEENGLKERAVTIENNQFVWCTQNKNDILSKKLNELQKKYHFPVGFTSEIHLNLENMIRTLSTLLTEGYLLFADYGYSEKEYYHHDRHQGTLKCFHRHQSYEHPLNSPGLYDITAHVNFTEVITTAYQNGCELMGYTTQAAFLLSCGLINKALSVEKELKHQEQFSLHQKIKVLTFPNEMGEVVKIMALKKKSFCDAIGFSHVDLSHKL